MYVSMIFGEMSETSEKRIRLCRAFTGVCFSDVSDSLRERKKK